MLLLLHGPNSYLSKERLNEIISSHKNKFGEEGIISFDGSAVSVDAIFQEVESVSMFSINKLVIVKHFSENKKQKDLVDIFSDKDFSVPQNVEIIFWENKGADKRTAFFNLFKTKGKVEEFSNLSGGRLFSWIKAEFKNRGSEISSDAIKILVEHVGDEMWRIAGEIEKLSIFCENKIISAENVREIVPQSAIVEIWGLTDAIGAGNRKKALEIFERLLRQGEDPVRIISLIIWQYRQLIQILYEVDRGKSESQISRDLKINPYVVKKIFRHVSSLNFEKLKIIYDKLVEIDFGVKTSTIDPRFAITLLLSAV